MRNPTFLRLGLALAIALSAVFISSAAFADKATEASAKALQKKAMDEDYLATDFSKAADKLNKAISSCGADKCSANLRALLKRDLGVVDIGGQLDKDAGSAAFVEAIKLDGTIALDPDLKTKDLEAAWEAAKKKAGGGGGKTPPPDNNGGGEPSGDFNHSPATEQAIRTPVPIYAEYTGSEALVRVIAKYKAFGMTEFKQLELKKMGNGWGGQVPCTDVQQGDLQYYLQGFNAQSDPVATGGDRNHPYAVKIKNKIDGDPPHLPDQPAPTQCADTGDCPPGFPCAKPPPAGGGTEGGTKLEGEECEENNECKSNECKDTKCTAPPDESAKFPRVWIGVSGALDLNFLGSGTDVCSLNSQGLPANSSGYYCTNSDGSNYPARNYGTPPDTDTTGAQNKLLTPGKAGSVNGGTVVGNTRVDLSFDYALTRQILVGARLGLVLGRYPGSAYGTDGGTTIPIHAEGRFTYLFLPGGVTSLVNVVGFAMLGASEFDGEVDVPVTEVGTPGTKTIQAWHTAGPFFGGVGGGIRLAFPVGKGGKYMAAQVAPKFIYALGNGGAFLIEPEAALQFGF